MAELKKLSELTTGASGGGGVSLSKPIEPMSILDGLKVIDNILDKIQNLTDKKEAPKTNVIDQPYSTSPPPVEPFKPVTRKIVDVEPEPKPEPVKEVIKEVEKPLDNKIDFDEKYNEYFNKVLKGLDFYIMAYTDTKVSEMKANLSRDKEKIKDIIKGMM